MTNYDVGTLIDGKYYLQSIIQHREESKTFRAWHRQWEIPLVIKIFYQPPPHRQERLSKEAQEWIELGIHPNIVSAYFAREIEDNLLLFLQFVPGPTVNRVKKRIGTNIPEVLRLTLEVAKGMLYLHQENVVHGNLKPGSIIIDKNARVRITNIRWDYWQGLEMLTKGMRSSFYGQSMDADELQAVRARAVEFLSYQPPEYFFNKNFTPSVASDIYAFGVLLYQMLSNALPFSREQDIDELFLTYKKKHQEAETPGLNLPDSPAALVQLVGDCLNKNPEARPQNFAPILAILEDAYRHHTDQPYIFESFPENTLLAMSLNNRALGHIDCEEWSDAEKILQEVGHLDSSSIVAPLNLELLHLQRQQISHEQFLQQIQRYKLIDNPSVYLFLGKSCLEYGCFIDQIFAELDNRDDKDERLSLLAGDLSYRLGSYQKARDIYKELAQHHHRQEISYRLGAAALALKLIKEAQSAWETGMRQEIPLWDLIIGYSMLLSMHGEWAQARRYLDRAVHNVESYIHQKPPRSTWSQVNRLMASNSCAVIHVTLSSDEKCIFAQTEDGKSHLWEWPSAKKRKSVDLPPDPHKSAKITGKYKCNRLLTTSLQNVAIAADGHTGVIVHGDNVVRIWDMKQNLCQRELVGHEKVVTAVTITANGQTAVSGSIDQTLRIWEVASGRCLACLAGHSDAITCVAISEDGKLVASAAWDRTLRIWDIERQECRAVFGRYQDDITALCLSADSRLVISGDSGRSVRIWDIASCQLLAALQGHQQNITSVAISSDSHLVISGSSDGTVGVYEDIAERRCPIWVRASYMPEHLPEPLTLEQRQQLYHHQQKFDECLNEHQLLSAFSHYRHLFNHKQPFARPSLRISKKLATIAEQEGYKRGRLLDYHLSQVFIHDNGVIAFAVANDDFFFSVSQSSSLKRWFFQTGHSDVFWQKPSLSIAALAVSPNTNLFCFCGKDGLIYLWERPWDRWNTMEGNAVPVQCIKISVDGKRAVSGSRDGTIQYWNLEKEQLISDANRYQTMITDLAITRNDMFAISSSLDGSIYCWNLETMECVMRNQKKTAPLLTLSISQAKKATLVSGGIDGSIRQWSMGTGLCHNLIKAHQAPITAIHIHRDGHLVLSGGQEGYLKLWHLEMRKCLAKIEAHCDAISQVQLSDDGEWAFSASHDGSLKIWKLHWQWEQ